MALERILKIFFFLKPVTEYLFGKTKRKGERKGGKGTKVYYIVAICTMLFIAFFVTYVPRKKVQVT